MEKKIFIFMLMPSYKEFDSIYEIYIKNPLIKQGYMVKRDKEIPGSSKIMEDILHNIRAAEIIIADLTDQNVNVFYELGIAFEKRKYLILIAQKGEILPFDLSQRRTIFYETSEDGLKKLSQEVFGYVKLFKRVQYIDEMITKFGESESYYNAIDYWDILKDFEPDLKNRQINEIAEVSARNYQIYSSYRVSPLLKSFFKRHKEVISKETIEELKKVGFSI